MIDWSETNSDWGKPGHNVHVAANGSFVPDAHTSSEVTE